MSDAYILNEDFTLTLANECSDIPPVVTLDDRFYQLHSAMRARFPAGAPSLRRCCSLTVRGDVTFGRHVSVHGKVTVTAPSGESLTIADNTTLRSEFP